MRDILKEAIADAKAVRETALANAKMALEEAFTPQLKSMLSAKLKEDEMDDEEEMSMEDEMGGEEEEEIPAEEGYYEDEEVGDEEPAMGVEEPDMEEEGVIEINGVKYAPVVSEDDEFGGEEEVPGEEEEEGNLDLEAVIRELESELSEGDDEDEETVDEQDDAYDEKAKSTADGATLAEEDDAYDEKASSADKNDGKKSSDLAEGDDSDDDDVEIDESMFLEGEDEDEEELEEVDKSSGVGTSDNSVADTDKSSGVGNGDNSLSEELREYKEAVRFLKDKLHEVNILNAKLLFTNKLFKQFSLDNNQKLKVVETFDRTQSTREIKLVYSTLAEQFSDNGSIVTKKSISESASSAVGSTKPSKGSQKVISEENNVADRFRKLAGLIK